METLKVDIKPSNRGIYHAENANGDAAKKVNELLQFNHENWHILWDFVRAGGMHNHQVHSLLTLLALGASGEEIVEAFKNNESYQQSISTGDELQQLVITTTNYAENLGRPGSYLSWVKYFSQKIDESGSQAVLEEYLFADSPSADDLLGRMYEGAVHPIIHLGFGIEFEQPAIVAEALALAAIHSRQCTDFLLATDTLAKNKPLMWDERPLTKLFDDARGDDSITLADCWRGGSFDVNGDFFHEAPTSLLELAATYKLDPDCSEETFRMRLAEMVNVAAWFTCAAKPRTADVKIDFFFMHCVTCSIFVSVFANQSWLSKRQKIRILEWKVRMDLIIYVCQGAPEISMKQVEGYKPRHADITTWEEIFGHSRTITDDGHLVKFIRALCHGSIISEPYENSTDVQNHFPIKGAAWKTLANMAIDTTEITPEIKKKWGRGYRYEWTDIWLKRGTKGIPAIGHS